MSNMQVCPSSPLWACKCSIKQGIMHNAVSNVAYYHTSSLVAIDQEIYILIFPTRGLHYMHAVMHAIASDDIQKSPLFMLSGRMCRNIVATVPNQTGFEIVWWTLVKGTVHIRVIQAWLKRMLSYKRLCRRLALAMALHPRLGRESPLRVLCQDHMEPFLQY